MVGLLRIVVLGLPLLLVQSVPAGVTVRRELYRGWRNCYRITNGTVDLVVIPQIGRIMRYGFVRGPNVLWNNPELRATTVRKPGEWMNYGGDKLWPAPQSLWKWPPDPVFDGSPQEVEILPNGLRLQTKASPRFGVRFERRITMAEQGSGVTLRNKMVNVSPRAVELAVWQIAQVDDPEITFLQAEPNRYMPNGWHGFGRADLDPAYHILEGTNLALRRNPKEARKFGTASRLGELTARKAGNIFLMSSPTILSGKYPDEGSAQQVFLSADPAKYVELELMSPMRKLPPGKAEELVVRWSLEKTP